MDTIAEPHAEDDAPSDEFTEEVWSEEEEEEWLEADDTRQIESALVLSHPKKQERKKDWLVAVAGAMTLHGLLFVVATTVLSQFGLPVHWDVAKGNSAAQEGATTASEIQREDAPSIEQTPTFRPPLSSSKANVRQTMLDELGTDSSDLRNHAFESMPTPPDPIIGIGASAESQALPRFATTRPVFQIAAAKPGGAPTAAPQTATVAGDTIPPRVATLNGGQRGKRDGLDSRGLPIPDYPAESRRRGEEGVVVIDVEVLPDGKVGSIRVASDGGHPRLSAAAVEKLKTANFEPARRNGKAVEGHILIPYRFTLE